MTTPNQVLLEFSLSQQVLILVTISLCLFFNPPLQIKATAPNSPTKLVKNVCQKTNNYSFCVKALGSDRRTASASHMLALAKIALELAITNATNTRAFINDMLSSNATKPELKPPLKSCVFWYDAVVGSFKSAYGELEEDPMTANYDTLIAGDDAGYCEKSLTSARVHIDSVSARNSITKYFSSIGYVVTDFLQRAPSPPST